MSAATPNPPTIKCLVWDLDNTLWQGVLLEDTEVRLHPEALRVLQTLDQRGILHSIASRNDPDRARAQLRAFGLADYFLYPQIHWNSKVQSLKAIAKDLNIAIDALALLDDDCIERHEVAFSLPGVLCLDAADLPRLPELPRFQPRVVTDDAKNRRLMYLQQQQRQRAETEFSGPREDFLATLNMVAAIAPAEPADLIRAQELTVRTHQLNSTGRTYGLEELQSFLASPRHLLLMARLTDRFGDYGQVGLTVIEREPASAACSRPIWTIRLLLVSCRVVATGLGTVFLHQIMRWAKQAEARLRADFLPTPVNRMMRVTYSFAGFKPVARDRDMLVFECDLATIPPCPPYMRLIAPASLGEAPSQ